MMPTAPVQWPKPAPADQSPPAPAWPELPAPPRTDLQCYATGCTSTPRVHWQRRLTPAEVAAEHAQEQAKRTGWLELRDVQQPMPDYGPLPEPATYSYLVHACGQHAIAKAAAALIHQAHCPGPDSERLPDCGCEPEPQPEAPVHPEQELPAHWVTAGGD